MTSRRVRPDPVLLDTGPLLTYLAMRYSDHTKAPKTYRDTLFWDIRKHGERFSETALERFRKLVESRHALTTPNVILDATNLLEYSESSSADGFLKFSVKVLFGGEISEIWYSLEEICKEAEYIDLVHRF